MNIYQLFSILIIVSQFIYNSCVLAIQEAVEGECNPVNALLGRAQSYNCCMEFGVACINGHITSM